MKVTVEIEDELHREAREYARAHGTTLKELVESGLQREIAEWNRDRTSSVLGVPAKRQNR